MRYGLLFRTLELEQDAVVRARLAYRGTEAQRILGLAGVSADALDRAPRDERGWKGAPGAGPTGPRDKGSPAMDEPWSARETLKHAIAVERSYRANTAHALHRAADEPLTLPADRRPQPDPPDTEGDGSHERITPADELARLDADHEARLLVPSSA